MSAWIKLSQCLTLLFISVAIDASIAQDSKYSTFDYTEDGVLTIGARDFELFVEFLSDTTQRERQQHIDKLAIKGYPYDTFQSNIRLLNKLTRLKSLEFKAPFGVAYFPDSLWQFDSLTYFSIYFARNPVTMYGSTVQSPQLKDIALVTARSVDNRNVPIHSWDSITILKPEAFAHVEQFLCRGCDINALWDWLKNAPNLRLLRLTDAYISDWKSSKNEFKNLNNLELFYTKSCPIKQFDFRAQNLRLLRIQKLRLLPQKLVRTRVKALHLDDIYIKGRRNPEIYRYIRRKAPDIEKIEFK